ncbi:VOC family protein [Luteimicrobium sp. DT211]|uniref:VOC family protein n=1 Tax=Luteimicrobium sp. DT211 TaxID=3393412 RepID=UPI003CE944FC
MDVRLVAIQLDAPDPAVPATFWAGLLGRGTVVEPAGTLLPGDGTQVGVRFVRSAEAKVGQNPVHLHLTSTSLADQRATVTRALELGGRHVDVGQLPEEGHVVLGDPDGNELCVIEPNEPYLAGTGFLGEVTCRGTRDVGLFWSEALGWPLVWDQDEETAVQSPDGGTKVSWGGEPVDPAAPPQRQRLELAATGELRPAVERLVALGATVVDDPATPDPADALTLADPDGQVFRLRRT